MRALGRDVGKIGAGDDCPYSGVCPRLFGIDRYDPGVSVGATALDPAPKHTRDRHVGAAVEQPWVAQLPAIHVLREVWTSWFSACLPSRCARCRPLLRSGRNPMIVMVTRGTPCFRQLRGRFRSPQRPVGRASAPQRRKRQRAPLRRQVAARKESAKSLHARARRVTKRVAAVPERPSELEGFAPRWKGRAMLRRPEGPRERPWRQAQQKEVHD